tara:strand:+ start:6020 stop:6262 length:243 start_codon:yes stop_codon:yes gene_type:complete
MSKQKKLFRVIAKMSDCLELYVEAEDEDQAWEFGKSADGGCFTILPDTQGSDWWIYDVEPVEKKEVPDGENIYTADEEDE